MKCRIKKGDFVQIVKGKDIGKKGRVIHVVPEDRKVLVEGVSFAKKHVRPRKIDQQGGIVHMEQPISIANVMYFCLKCEKPARLGAKFLEDKSKARYCKKCNEVIETK